jgi:hypothetical protein
MFSREPIAALIAAAGEPGRLSLLVGAGASMEAGLPSWDGLLDRLLLRGGEAAGLIAPVPAGTDPSEDERSRRRRWLAEAARDGPLGKAALAETLAGGERDVWIREELFRPAAGPGSYFPGPIARAIPGLREAFGADLRVMTLNYDDLIEQAYRQDGRFDPWPLATDDHRVPDGKVGVVHLHGYLGRDGRPAGRLVLSEADYMEMQRAASWQQTYVNGALMDSTVVFVGTSMLDPNVIRYLHDVRPSTARPSRFALFVRQGTYADDVPQDVRTAREQALARRWEALGVVAVFVDHYTDVAQVLSEAARHRELGRERYVALRDRAGEWIEAVEREILGLHDDARFPAAQGVLSGLLRSALARAVAEAERLGGRRWEETLQLALWLVDAEGGHLTNWVMTDRLHLDRRTIEPVAVDEYARWVAVRSYCAGTPLAEARDIYASRWRFIRGTPLVLDTERHGRIPVGCLTTATLAPRTETQLDRMPGEVLAAFNDALSDAVLTLLDQPFAEHG